MQKANRKKNIGGLLSLLAVDSTQDVNKILSEHGIAPSNDPSALVNKLATLYTNASDKLVLEKKFAAIHPHKGFILKYSVSPNGESMVKAANVKVADDQETKQLLRQFISTAPPINEFSNCEGNPNCGCNKQKMSNACGCSGFSGFDAGGVSFQGARDTVNNNKDLIIGGVIMVTLLGLFLHYKK